MREVAIIGVGMHRFGKHLDKSLNDLGREAIWAAIDDAGIDPHLIRCAYVGNSLAGLLTGQEGSAAGDPAGRGTGRAPRRQRRECLREWHHGVAGAWLEVAAGTR